MFFFVRETPDETLFSRRCRAALIHMAALAGAALAVNLCLDLALVLA